MIQIKKQAYSSKPDAIIVWHSPKTLEGDSLKFLKNKLNGDSPSFVYHDGNCLTIAESIPEQVDWKVLEKVRKRGASALQSVNQYKSIVIHMECNIVPEEIVFAYLEGFALADYTFNKYKTEDKKATKQKKVSVSGAQISNSSITKLNIVVESTFVARDLVNEPYSFLTAPQFSEEIKKLGKEAGFEVEIWNEAKIQSQKMGGLLSVNKGSKEPPTFNILEYKPKKAINKQPYVLVGKGVVYDTGGLSLKPTPNSMDYMKCDMAGGATVAAAIYAVAKLKLPIHLVALIPATDNRPGEDAYAPGDVITMYNGKKVEVLNTDAEGRLILADALHYAGKLNPELVMDFATLTGAAVRAIGSYATAFMGTASVETKNEIKESAFYTFERLVEFPLWDEYGDELKSEIADFTNLGKGEGGQVSAGKFLEKFTSYPWLHFDIAGPSYNHSNDSYRLKGGTGVGVRLLIDFFTKKAAK